MSLYCATTIISPVDCAIKHRLVQSKETEYPYTGTWIKCHPVHPALTVISNFKSNKISLISLKSHFVPGGLQLY